MATKFKNIRDYIRAALQDYDPSNFLYADQALNSQIKFQILADEDGVYLESDTELEAFTADLTNKQKLIFSLNVSLRILSGIPDSFFYTSPVLNVRRFNQVNKQIENLQDMLDDANGGKFAIASDNDFNAVVAGFTRYQEASDAAQSAV